MLDNEYTDEEIELIQIMFVRISEQDITNLGLKNINNLKLDKRIVKVTETKTSFKDMFIPLNMDLKYYGEPVKFEVIDGRVSSLILFDQNILNSFDLATEYSNKKGSVILNKKITKYQKFYIYLNKSKIKNSFNPSTVQDNDDNLNFIYFNKFRYVLLLILEDINKTRTIEVFDINYLISKYLNSPEPISYEMFGKLCSNDLLFVNRKYSAIDEPLSLDKKTFKRTINDFTIHFNNDKIILFENKINLPTINYKETSLDKITKNSNIGVFDIETYYNSSKDKSFVYAVGFKIFRGETRIFYKEPNISSEELLLECIREMLNKYNNYTFYVHNFHGFDSIYIIKAIIEFNNKHSDHYKIGVIWRDKKMIKIELTIKVGKTRIKKIKFHDSYLMLPSSLDKLANDFECELKKGYFPYEFVSESKLYYIGGTPDKKYFKNITDIEYKKIISEE